MSEELKQYEKSIKTKKLLLALSIVLIIGALAYMGLHGAGDSRYVDSHAITFASQTIIIGLVYIIHRIHFYSRLLADKSELWKDLQKVKEDKRKESRRKKDQNKK